MFQEILYAIVGKWGRAAIEWMLANPVIVAGVLLVWMGVMVWSRSNLRQVERQTGLLVLEGARRALGASSRLTAEQLYDQLYPDWSEMVRKTAPLVPHRWELWPLPGTPSIVRKQIGFSPHWVWGHLLAHGMRPAGSDPGAREPAAGERGSAREPGQKRNKPKG